MNDSKPDILVFKDGEVVLDVEVHPSEETIWLSQEQMAKLFEVDRTSILRHINHVYRSGELEVDRTCAEIAHMGSLKVQAYKKKRYNLEMITSIGYRVNSRRGILFRRWVSRVLKEYLIQGYSIDQNRLVRSETDYRRFCGTVQLMANMVHRKELTNAEAKGLLEVIGQYAYALEILEKYDRQTLAVPNVPRDEKPVILKYEDAMSELKRMRPYQESRLFGREKDNSFQGALNAIYQSAGGKDAYPTVEEKASHLLYFIVKDHPFVDGNKRIAASMYLWFLDLNQALKRVDGTRVIEDNALVAMVMMIALSKPEEKDTIIKILVNLIHQGNKTRE